MTAFFHSIIPLYISCVYTTVLRTYVGESFCVLCEKAKARRGLSAHAQRPP